jgi:hypothetical protein
MLRTLTLRTAILVNGLLAAGCGPVPPAHAGHYRDVSESESSIDLFLEADGSARILLQMWSPGSAGVGAVDTIVNVGTWSASGDEITVRYGTRSATLEFSEARSFQEFGCSGEAPGLRGISGTGGEDLLVDKTFWESEALRTIPDPCS